MAYKCPKCGNKLWRSASTAGGKKRWQCRSNGKYCYSTTSPESDAAKTQAGKRSAKTPVFTRALGGTTTLLVTAVQNATPVHAKFLKAAETFCNDRNAELIAVPVRYKNPTSRWAASQSNEEVWAPEITPYLCNQRKNLNNNLVLLGDVKVQSTASSPLTGFEAITHGESGILAHTKLQLRTIPTPQHRMAKVLTTTGAMTHANYTDSKAGKLGEFHHTLGACIVELKGKKFHIRQANADKKSGAFVDLEREYLGDGSCKEAPPALALSMGDTHVDAVCPDVVQATFGKGGIVEALKPRHLVWHDLLDGYSVNPHHAGNPFVAIGKLRSGKSDAKAEVMRALEFVEKHTPDFARSVVVPSNHDDFLSRWVVSQDWRTAPGNAEFYLETALAMVRGVRTDDTGTYYPSPFSYWGEKYFSEGDRASVRFLAPEESFALVGVELGMHGDKGPNGSRGSRHNLRRIGVRSIIGHTHSPGIEEGCYQNGTSTRLSAEYTLGPSSWLNTHTVLYANGKRSLILIIDGEWRL